MDEHIEAALMAAGAQMQAKDAEIERLRAKLGQLVLPAIDAAVAAERERCAKLCESLYPDANPNDCADEIRKA